MTGASKLVAVELMDRGRLLQLVKGERSRNDVIGTVFKEATLSSQTKTLNQGYNWELSGSSDWNSPDLPLSLLRSYAYMFVSLGK